MIATGVSLALTISCKMVGLFAFLAVGTAVVIDLWNLLDIRRGLTIVRRRFETVLIVAGTRREALCRARVWPHPRAGRRLHVLVLGPLHDPHALGPR